MTCIFYIVLLYSLCSCGPIFSTTDADTDEDADADTDRDVDADTGTEADADAGTDGDVDAGTGTGVDADAEAEAEADAVSRAGLGAEKSQTQIRTDPRRECFPSVPCHQCHAISLMDWLLDRLMDWLVGR